MSYPSCGDTGNRHTPRPGSPRPRSGNRGLSRIGDRLPDTVHETAHRRGRHPVQHHPVQGRAHQPQRRPVRPGQCDQRPGLLVRCHRDIGIQHREQASARPGRLPPQRQDGCLPPRHQLTDMHLDQTRYSRSRTHPCQPLIQLPERLAGCTRQPAAPGQAHQPGLRGIKAGPGHRLSPDEHLPIQPSPPLADRDQRPGRTAASPLSPCRLARPVRRISSHISPAAAGSSGGRITGARIPADRVQRHPVMDAVTAVALMRAKQVRGWRGRPRVPTGRRRGAGRPGPAG